MAKDFSINQQVYQMLLSKGVSPAVAAGAIGSLVGESGKTLNPRAINPGDGADGSDSIGIYQANGPRARLIHQTAAQMGTTWSDPRAQIAAMSKELDTTHSHVLAGLKAGTSVADGTRLWTTQFEVPGDAAAQVGKRLPHGYEMARVLGVDPSTTGSVAAAPVMTGTGIPATAITPGLLGFGATPMSTALPGQTTADPTWAGIEGTAQGVTATPADAGIGAIVPAALGAFGASGGVGLSDTGQTISPTGGLLGMDPAMQPPAIDPSVTGGPTGAHAAAGANAAGATPGGDGMAALAAGAKGLMRLGALGARGPLHYAPPSNGGSPVNRADVQTPDIYKSQGFILPRIATRGLLG